ncbi:hypothetical protein L6452_28590 [Arctium lappa]|uniref:Uncharacterized protein n=1 Tax=Arctium lappa TaxID=4217 RepID=A0ACB8ZZ40_ARCLA|nr:hypothetical protein L6452_28590 [Arctium lappa]
MACTPLTPDSCGIIALTFEVGGQDGWTLNPSENYNNWSGRLRFLINDTLHFKYDGGSDSVLVVNKGDYDGCNMNSPIMKLDGGDSLFKFDRSGPFYFVSGNKSNCDRGQKLIVVVLAVRNRSPPSPATLPPAPAVSPVIPPSPGSPSPAGVSPSSPSPAGVSPGSPSPAAVSPGSPSPAGVSPGSPSPAAVSPGSPPPAAVSPGSPSGTPGSNPPAGSPGGGSSGSPGGATGESPGGNNPADVNTPPPPSPSAAPSVSGAVTASLATVILALWWLN